ncbi:GTP 3',8-cyclase MoaA [Enteractinococcus coprophilus]|uniref:GTP 3',8-cyclase n=1 Tax=Enteractinococcus coprophilus TaxID=1027633 RepID=A0A542ZYP7_9MICC|nr:GTP 3',8-cyclase MoaA [Enteractinococcus coprophilus]TQL65487.1 cyclic pyranopterin phosphate synthase [Enteractinococcus coprophilus]
MTGLIDQFGRTATDLRMSLIDKCNLRCRYCMPAEGLDWLKKNDMLTADEVIRLADIAITHLGIEGIRFTGGEPLVRADLVDIIRAVHSAHPQIELAMTTNGINLEKKIDDLVAAGLSRINVSLDTVCPETFAKITRRDRLTKVLEGLHSAKAAGLDPIKINAVLLRGLNDDQAAELLTWTLEHGYQLRFIEQMPLDADHNWTRDNMVTAAEIREQISQVYTLTPHEVPRGSAPAELFDVKSQHTGKVLGTVGIIASVTEPFCAACTRTRITADAKVRSCLFSHTETDLMEVLRDGSSDEVIADAWREAMWHKPKAHGQTTTGLGMPGFVQPERTMSAIGG